MACFFQYRYSMENICRKTEKQKREKEALECHDQLHRLFTEDRLSFEKERKRMIDEFFKNIKDKKIKKKLWELQIKWDKNMKNADSEHNRFVLAKKMFWDHFHENWNPAINEFDSLLKEINAPSLNKK